MKEYFQSAPKVAVLQSVVIVKRSGKQAELIDESEQKDHAWFVLK